MVRIKSSFLLKAAAASVLVALGDWLVWMADGAGSTIGVFAIAWAVATLLLTRSAWRRPGAMAAGALALVLGAILLDDTSLLAILLRGWLPLLPLPRIGGAVFLTLFASANPVIGDALARIGMPSFDVETLARVMVWGVIFTIVWATLRPRRIQPTFLEAQSEFTLDLPGVSTGSVTRALITFNALFAIENALDLTFLWSGAPLPKGVSLASYAHQGAYPLIATALLAGLFVLVALRPGSDTAKVPLIRQLVVAWVAQNIFLVASSILRTLDYIQVYQLTVLRIAALIWMALVAVGLVLLVWRMLRGKTAAWLSYAYALAAGLVLVMCCAIDLGAVAATWDVRHAKEAGGQGQALDLCYLNQLDSSALVALVEMEQRPGLAPDFAQRLAWVRHHTLQQP